MAGPPERAGDAAVLGIDYRGMGQSMDVFLSKNSAAFHSNTLRLARAIKRDVRTETAAQFELLAPLTRDADRVVGASLAFAAPSCAEHAGRPYRFIAFAPETFASRHHPALGERRQDLPRWLNSVSWWVTRRLDNWLLRAPINQGRARLAQGPAAGVRGGCPRRVSAAGIAPGEVVAPWLSMANESAPVEQPAAGQAAPVVLCGLGRIGAASVGASRSLTGATGRTSPRFVGVGPRVRAPRRCTP